VNGLGARFIRIPQRLLNPVTAKLITTYYPQVNPAAPINPANGRLVDFFASLPGKTIRNLGTIRLDHDFSARDKIYGVYNGQSQDGRTSAVVSPFVGLGLTLNQRTNQTMREFLSSIGFDASDINAYGSVIGMPTLDTYGHTDTSASPSAAASLTWEPAKTLDYLDPRFIAYGTVAAGDLGVGRALVKTDKNNLAPRLGVAWRLTDKIVLRGGYGFFYPTSAAQGIRDPLATNSFQVRLTKRDNTAAPLQAWPGFTHGISPNVGGVVAALASLISANYVPADQRLRLQYAAAQRPAFRHHHRRWSHAVQCGRRQLQPIRVRSGALALPHPERLHDRLRQYGAWPVQRLPDRVQPALRRGADVQCHLHSAEPKHQRARHRLHAVLDLR
jgi:hypothetical protein